MDSGIAALAGALGGAIVTGLLTWISSTSASRREERAQRRILNLELCTQFLSAIDADLRSLDNFEQLHGGMPEDWGYTFESKATHNLTALELRCPQAVAAAAQTLHTSLFSYATGPGTYDQLQSARTAFLHSVQNKL